MINFGLQVRRAAAQDHRQIANLIFHEANTHRHLDWRPVLDWLGSQNYWVLEEGGNITAALACPEDPPHVAWIRLFAYSPHLSGPETWSALWKTAYPEMRHSNPKVEVAAIIIKQWFQNILLSNGFKLKQNIVLLQWSDQTPRAYYTPQGIKIRPMQVSDLEDVTKVDFSSFGHFWHNTQDALHRALLQASYATVAEDDSGVIGYQISTGNPFGAHLARLGVYPEAQGRGIGTALVNDLIERMKIDSGGRLSVNTQVDNAASLTLYKKLGFVRTGEYFPVLTYSPDDL